MFVQKILIFTAAAVMITICLNNHSVDATQENLQIMQMKIVLPYLRECAKDFGLTVDELVETKFSSNVDYCAVACVFKKAGVITSEGKYDMERADELTTPHIEDEESLASMRKLRQDCLKINDQEVSDGAKGCDRALLLYKCFDENEASTVVF